MSPSQVAEHIQRKWQWYEVAMLQPVNHDAAEKPKDSDDNKG